MIASTQERNERGIHFFITASAVLNGVCVCEGVYKGKWEYGPRDHYIAYKYTEEKTASQRE